MKVYPYIYSLSTLGLIHHYNNDYLFNRTRTDFTGDSGTGKSMIADLLQLIFVGSGVFEAATESIEEKRKPKGMVLNDKSRGLGGKGYTFLNIAVERNAFLVIGMYLEHSTNLSKAFIVLNGYDIDNPEYLSSPVLHEKFLKNDTILPIQDLVEYFEEADMNCISMNMSNYHRFLHDQNILPFDLVEKPEKLKTFALIIRSFSRGKGFKLDSKSLQDFLFGVDKEKVIKSNYEKEIQKLNDSLQDSANYKSQIAKLKEKKKALLELAEYSDTCRSAEELLIANEFNFWNNNQAQLSTRIKELSTSVSQITLSKIIVERKDIDSQIKKAKDRIDQIKLFRTTDIKKLEADEKDKRAIHSDLQSRNEKVKSFQIILNQFEDSIEKAKENLLLFQKNTKERNSLSEFIQQLKSHSIYEEFSTSIWSSNYNNALKEYNDKNEELNRLIVKNDALLKFTDIEDEKSIAFWAINRKLSLNIEQESLLIKYGDLIVSSPQNKELKYSPKPEDIFNELVIHSSDETGFWVNFNGILEYIDYTKEQFLNTPDKKRKQKYFNDQYKEAKKSLDKARAQKKSISNFYQKIHLISGLEKNIELFIRKEKIEGFNRLDFFVKNEAVFDQIIADHKIKKELNDQFINAETIWRNSDKKLSTFKGLIGDLRGVANIEKEELKRKEILVELEDERRKKDGKIIRYRLLQANYDHQKRVEELDEKLKTTTLAAILANITKKEVEQRTTRIEKKQDLSKCKQKICSILETIELKELPPPVIDSSNVLTFKEIERLKKLLSDADEDFNKALSVIKSTFLKEESYKYEKENDWKTIAQGMLPGFFRSQEITKELLTSEVDERLENIIEQNTIIGDRKVESISTIFSRVEDVLREFTTEIGDLKTFFQGNDKRITGGYKVVLSLAPSKDFPISWIGQFKKRIRAENFKRTGLFKEIDEGINFQDIIIESYKQCGGKRSNPKITDLLNPKKYFDLSFNLKKDNVKNSGSTGQVYSAIALLCIARISLLEQNNNKRRTGIRFMPIDEAEGLGSNYDMLSKIANNEDYQIVSLSINPVGEFEDGSHYIYMLNEPEDDEVKINGPAFGQFTEDDLEQNLQELDFTYFNG